MKSIREELSKHRFSTEHWECTCGTLFAPETGSPKTIFDMVLDHLEAVVLDLIGSADANTMLADLAEEYKTAVNEAHKEDHCTIKCNETDEKYDTGSPRFHDEELSAVEQAESRLNGAIQLARINKKAPTQTEPVISTPEHVFYSDNYDSRCAICLHSYDQHDIAYEADMQMFSEVEKLRLTHVSCRACDRNVDW